MMHLQARNINGMFPEALWRVQMEGAEAPSRNGKVIALPYPAMLEYSNPTERVLFHPERDANPFFHLFESIWMLSGGNDVATPARFAPQIKEYSDDGLTLHGAYGARWRLHFGIDQVDAVIDMLRKDPTTRRAVIGMWDPHSDLARDGKDLPCNTHIYFDANTPFLNMTVCNRSNDLVWGACGANAVHMSFLHEYVARSVGMEVGFYYQFTNNLHVYEKHWPMLDAVAVPPDDSDPYAQGVVHSVPIFTDPKDKADFDADCRYWLDGDYYTRTEYFAHTVMPMYKAWRSHKDGDDMWALQYIQDVLSPDWKRAGKEWIERRIKRKATS